MNEDLIGFMVLAGLIVIPALIGWIVYRLGKVMLLRLFQDAKEALILEETNK